MCDHTHTQKIDLLLVDVLIFVRSSISHSHVCTSRIRSASYEICGGENESESCWASETKLHVCNFVTLHSIACSLSDEAGWFKLCVCCKWFHALKPCTNRSCNLLAFEGFLLFNWFLWAAWSTNRLNTLTYLSSSLHVYKIGKPFKRENNLCKLFFAVFFLKLSIISK